MKNAPEAKPPEPGQPDPHDLSIKFTIIFGIFAFIPLVLMYHFLSIKKTPSATDNEERNVANGPTPPSIRFKNITAGSGLEQPIYGMGVAVGDFDNDGLVDVFITAVGGNRLFHNEGHGKFRDVTAAAGVAGGEFSTSAAFVDYDNDGDLDLFV